MSSAPSFPRRQSFVWPQVPTFSPSRWRCLNRSAMFICRPRLLPLR
jgi:hypothetical protein